MLAWCCRLMDERTREQCRELARREVAEAPELTEHQQTRLRELFRGRVTKPEPRPTETGATPDTAPGGLS